MVSQHDCLFVQCSECREALSARMDDEGAPWSDALVDQHLHDCAGCRSWLVSAEAVNRSLRVQAAVPVPDLTATILRARAERAPKWRMPQLPWLRIALAWVGFAQLVFG